jgi:opacity protein-like surface antigen
MTQIERLFRLAPASLLVAFAALPAAAQSSDASFELTPYFGYRFEGNVTIGDSFDSIFDEGVDIDEGESFGVILDIPLTHGLQLEFLGSRQSTQAIRSGGIFNPSIDIADIDVTYAHVGLAYNWRFGQVTPYLAGSVGATILDPDLPNSDNETRASASLGGGVKIHLAEHVGIRLEGRAFWTDTEDGNGDDRCCEDEGGLFQGEALAGLIFSW